MKARQAKALSSLFSEIARISRARLGPRNLQRSSDAQPGVRESCFRDPAADQRRVKLDSSGPIWFAGQKEIRE